MCHLDLRGVVFVVVVDVDDGLCGDMVVFVCVSGGSGLGRLAGLGWRLEVGDLRFLLGTWESSRSGVYVVLVKRLEECGYYKG